jgi:hypothetical protein
MTELEEKLGNGTYATITPEGVDYSRFSLDKFKKISASGLFTDTNYFVVSLKDGQGRMTELFCVLRPFGKRAQLRPPIKPPAGLHDEGITLDSRMIIHMGKFFADFALIDPPYSEFTKTYEGEFKKVQITRIMPKGTWWSHMFVDLYTDNDSIISHFDGLGADSKKVFDEKERWDRYDRVKNYLKKMNELVLYGDENFSLTDTDIINFLKRHSGYVSPFLFNVPDDYMYFLLAFCHKNYDLRMIHECVVKCHEELPILKKKIEEYHMSIAGLHIATCDDSLRLLEVKSGRIEQREYRIFNPSITKEDLDKAAQFVASRGGNIKSPVRLTEGLWELGYLVFKRNRKIQPSKSSFALLKIKGKRQKCFQLSLFN